MEAGNRSWFVVAMRTTHHCDLRLPGSMSPGDIGVPVVAGMVKNTYLLPGKSPSDDHVSRRYRRVVRLPVVSFLLLTCLTLVGCADRDPMQLDPNVMTAPFSASEIAV